MKRLAFFGYGSLVSPASAALTLGRRVEEVTPVRLPGWRRRWSTYRDNNRSEKTFARSADGSIPPFTLGLNIEPAPGEPGPNGVLIQATAEELDRLDLREMRYDRVDVTAALDGAGGFDEVVAWTAKPAHHAPTPPEGAVIMRTYFEAIRTAFTELGNGELELFFATTGEPPVELIDGTLVRDAIPLGNPRAW
jgi:cation transport regulator ChaC